MRCFMQPISKQGPTLGGPEEWEVIPRGKLDHIEEIVLSLLDINRAKKGHFEPSGVYQARMPPLRNDSNDPKVVLEGLSDVNNLITEEVRGAMEFLKKIESNGKNLALTEELKDKIRFILDEFKQVQTRLQGYFEDESQREKCASVIISLETKLKSAEQTIETAYQRIVQDFAKKYLSQLSLDEQRRLLPQKESSVVLEPASSSSAAAAAAAVATVMAVPPPPSPALEPEKAASSPAPAPEPAQKAAPPAPKFFIPDISQLQINSKALKTMREVTKEILEDTFVFSPKQMIMPGDNTHLKTYGLAREQLRDLADHVPALLSNYKKCIAEKNKLETTLFTQAAPPSASLPPVKGKGGPPPPPMKKGVLPKGGIKKAATVKEIKLPKGNVKELLAKQQQERAAMKRYIDNDKEAANLRNALLDALFPHRPALPVQISDDELFKMVDQFIKMASEQSNLALLAEKNFIPKARIQALEIWSSIPHETVPFVPFAENVSPFLRQAAERKFNTLAEVKEIFDKTTLAQRLNSEQREFVEKAIFAAAPKPSEKQPLKSTAKAGGHIDEVNRLGTLVEGMAKKEDEIERIGKEIKRVEKELPKVHSDPTKKEALYAELEKLEEQQNNMKTQLDEQQERLKANWGKLKKKLTAKLGPNLPNDPVEFFRTRESWQDKLLS